jgi:hypothetical protein
MALLQISLPFLLFTRSCLVISLQLSGHTHIIPTMQKRLLLAQLLVPRWALPQAVAATARVVAGTRAVAETTADIDLTTLSPRRYQSR